MLESGEPNKKAIVDEIAKRVEKQVEGQSRDLLRKVCHSYYEDLSADELSARKVDDLYGAILAHWNFAAQRKPGETLVRVYNPDFDQYSWQSTHTVVEITTDDMPFLVDSIGMEVVRQGLTVHLAAHPVYQVVRGGKGQLKELAHDGESGSGAGNREAWMHFEVDRQTEKRALDALRKGLQRVLGDVRAAVKDWQPMQSQLQSVMAEVAAAAGSGVAPEEAQEVGAFLQWLADDHFTFLGYRNYDLVQKGKETVLRVVPDSGLGILHESLGAMSKSFSNLPDVLRREARIPHLLILAKSNSRSTVHRSTYMDYIGVKRFDAAGKVIGEHRFMGLYTASAYNRNPQNIPWLRGKVRAVISRAGFDPKGHNGKALLNILETHPRDELIQTPSDELYDICLGILHLQERQRVKLFVRRDPYHRYFSCLLFVPRESYNTDLRYRMQDILMGTLGGESCEYTAQVSESPMARLHYIIRGRPDRNFQYDVHALEEELVEATRSWSDRLKRALVEAHGEEEGNRLHRVYCDGFTVGYREEYSIRTGVTDIEHMEELSAKQPLAMRLYRPLEAPEGILRFKLFNFDTPMALSDALPMMENMGVRVMSEHPFKAHRSNGDTIWIHDFRLRTQEEVVPEVSEIRAVFQDLFARVWSGEVDNDGFNRLAIRARLEWREILVLRIYFKYLRQLGLQFSQAYVEQALSDNPQIAQKLVALFFARLDPESADPERAQALSSDIVEAIDSVSSLDEDRILRRLHNVIEATVRTNYFKRDADGAFKSYVSIKLDPANISAMPLPRPHFEIFVYSTLVEGVHLRGGKVARGGLRWSDRREDYRKEILGLMKAQMVKNTVIVPVGAKGGFYVRQPGPDGGRPTQQQGIACYQTYIRGLLDITDNIVNNEIVPPRDVVRLDGDDPYLVVAADKGTAAFSDIANEVSKQYGFWLGDAFASGGSVGYDHKKMGITARGAWESVKRHFREMGRDIQTQPFTAIGVGAMFGDVFGNGMLLSRATKLVGAFSGEHIFLDPDPDPAKSYAERERLFKLPVSTWADYNTKLISKGGGVWSRSAKKIKLSPEVQQLLDVKDDQMAPTDLMRAMLMAPVDLFWNGGIGTYVKASHETDAMVGDRANDPVRINGCEMRALVVGEGGNLGLTQAGRIEYARSGGRINTDAIDNSGGVDCSDREVNIKILLNALVQEQDLTEKQRNKLLVEMTDDVAERVVMDNYRQTRAITITEIQAAKRLGEHQMFIRYLERRGLLNRQLEGLPTDEEIDERLRAGSGLTRPEIAVLISYAKIDLYNELLESQLPDDGYLTDELIGYFPDALQKRYRERMRGHRLAREIIATGVTNSLINRMGPTFVYHVLEETGAPASEVARAYAAAREVFCVRTLWIDIESLDNKISAAKQIEMMIGACRLVGRATLWLLRTQAHPLDVRTQVERFGPGVQTLVDNLQQLITAKDRKVLKARVRPQVKEGVPEALAECIASLDWLFGALDISTVAAGAGADFETVAKIFFRVEAHLALDWVSARAGGLHTPDHWHGMARAALREDLQTLQADLTASILRQSGDLKGADAMVDRWLAINHERIRHWLQMVIDIKSVGSVDIAMLSVALRELRNLTRLQSSSCPPGDPTELEALLEKLHE